MVLCAPRGLQTALPEPNFWRTKKGRTPKSGFQHSTGEPSPDLQGITRFSWGNPDACLDTSAAQALFELRLCHRYRCLDNYLVF